MSVSILSFPSYEKSAAEILPHQVSGISGLEDFAGRLEEIFNSHFCHTLVRIIHHEIIEK